MATKTAAGGDAAKKAQNRPGQPYWDAFELLKSRREEEKAQAKKLGKKPSKSHGVTIASVAREAGRSRSPIGYGACRYPEIRDAILDYGDSEQGPRTSASVENIKLRAEKRELEAEVKLALSKVVAMASRMFQVDKAFRNKRAEMKRRLQNKEGDHLAGSVVMAATNNIHNIHSKQPKN